MRQLAFDFGALAPPTLDAFIPGRNAELLHNVRNLAANGAGERQIYIWGAPDSGRTHLLKGAVRAACAAGMDAVYVGGGPDARIAEDLASRGFVAMDDVERLDGAAQLALFNICNAMREGRRALLACGNVPPARLPLRQDVLTRLAWGLIYEVHALSDEERMQALRDRAAQRGFALGDDVCRYLMSRVPRDLSTLFALLDALDRHSMELKRPVTVALARELLQTIDIAKRDAER